MTPARQDTFRHVVKCAHCGKAARFRKVRRWGYRRPLEWWEYVCPEGHVTEGTDRDMDKVAL